MFLNNIEQYYNTQNISLTVKESEQFANKKNVGLDKNGNLPLVSEQDNCDVEKTLSEMIAEKKGYKQTANLQIYKDERSGYYVVWNNEKQKFQKDKTIKKVYDNGFSERISPNYHNEKVCVYDTAGNEIGLASDINVKAKLCGLEKPDKYWSGQNYFKGLFYNPIDKKYYLWDDNKQDFRKTNIEIAGRDSLKVGNLYYKATKDGLEQIEEVTYYAEKYRMYEDVEQKGIYWSRVDSDKKDYVFDAKTKTFIEYISVDEQIRNEMVTTKADGIVGNFTQGNTGDCWLLSAVEALRPELMEKIKDENGNVIERIKSEYAEIDPDTGDITVKLKGPGLEYVITDTEINDALSADEPKYSYGEKEIVAIEMAIEKFFKDCLDKKIDSRFITKDKFYVDNELHGGYAADAITTLTGLKVNTLDKDNIKYGTLEEMLSNNYYVCAVMGEEYTDKKVSHSIAVLGYDDENIYYDDTNNATGEILSKKKEDFYRMCTGIQYAVPGESLSKRSQQVFKRTFGI